VAGGAHIAGEEGGVRRAACGMRPPQPASQTPPQWAGGGVQRDSGASAPMGFQYQREAGRTDHYSAALAL